MLQQQAKRFYKKAEACESSDGWEVRLDGRPLKTPAKSALRLPSAALAAAMADEWENQQDRLQPAAMPLTALCFTAIDLVRPHRADTIREIADFGATDLLCYRASHPQGLVERQHGTWQPLLDWVALKLDAPLCVTEGIGAVAQPAPSLQALTRAVEVHDDFALTALASATRISGSLVIGLALTHGRLDAEAAFDAAELDETFELEQWGEDAEANTRRQGLLTELRACERFVKLLQA